MKWSTILRRLQGGGTTRAIRSWRELSRSRNVSFWHEVPGLIGNGSSSSTALPESVSNIDRIEKIWKAMRATALVAWDRTLMATFSTRSRKTSCPSAITRACISMALPAWGSCFSRGVRIWTNSSRRFCKASTSVLRGRNGGRTRQTRTSLAWQKPSSPWQAEHLSCLTIIWIYRNRTLPGINRAITPISWGEWPQANPFFKAIYTTHLERVDNPPGDLRGGGVRRGCQMILGRVFEGSKKVDFQEGGYTPEN